MGFMDQERRERYKKTLLEMRMELASELHRVSNGAKDRDNTDAMDSLDLADASYSNDTNLARVEMLNLRIKEIDEALERIRDESYGICNVCGEDIPEGRLQVRPIARYCAQCKEDLEKRGEIK
jgi:DnaK suppressor protein